MTAARPLAGVRVLDLSRLLPGPYASLVLADLGADVVKVEDPMGGDYARWMPPMLGASSGLFHALNRGKRSVSLNLKHPDGQKALLALVSGGWDVVLESFRPGVMDRLGLSYEALQAASPGVILCSISGYGQTGPLAGKAGHDLNYIGRAGVLGFSGPDPEGPPTVPGVQIGDVAGGAMPAVIGILAALHARGATGEGRHVDISMTEGALGLLTMHLGALAGGGGGTRGEGFLHGSRPCYAVYPTLDGRYVTLGALEPHFWDRFCKAVDREDLVPSGLEHGEAGVKVQAEVAGIFRQRTRDDWITFLADHDCCCEPVWELDELADDPQHQARGTFFEVEDPIAGPVPGIATPVRFVPGDAPVDSPAPLLGAHTDEILATAGYDRDAVDALVEAGAALRAG